MGVGFEVTCYTAEGEPAQRAPGRGILPLQSDHSHRRFARRSKVSAWSLIYDGPL